MSVLSFPRAYFKGFLSWDPCTFNNNDWQAFQTFDGVNAALNWPFLATQGITQQNFYTTFRPWAIKLQPDNADNPTGVRVPAEWNMFGGHGVSFVQYNDFTTTITGGALGYNNPVTTDPLLGGPVAINGDGGSGPGRLVDTNPASFWSSQIYFGQMSFGGANCKISGPRNFRMHSRWLDLNRIYSTDQELTQPAASVGACFQTCIPYDQVTWPAASANSALATKLQQAASQAEGIMVRFTAYVNLYFRNGIFNGTAQQPRNYTELAAVLEAAWNEWNTSGSTSLFFSNPCYSHVVGTLGVWNAGEVASAPVGRYLAANSQVAAIVSTPVAAASPKPMMGHHVMMAAAAAPAAATPPPQVTLGPVVANVDYDAQLISLDLNSTIPENGTPGEWPSDLSKANFGTLTLGVANGSSFSSVIDIPYEQYAQAAYEASAGIIDIPFPNAGTAALLQSGTLAIQVQGQVALLEQQLSAQTDSRGIYVDQGAQADFAISVYDFGAISPDTNVMVAQYDANLSLIPTNGAPLIAFTSGNLQTVMSGGTTTAVTIVTSDQTGVASASVEWVAPGFAVLAFFPYSGTMLPGPPISLLGPCATTSGSITYAFYATVRTLPADNAVPQQFVDLWNASGGNQTEAWNFIYNDILYVYDMIFNVMLGFVNLGSQAAFAQSISSIWNAIDADYTVESSYAMPITRDLSAGKRLTLQLWIYLIANNYDVPNFNVNSIPPNWSPS
jgi:hypothetical protein